LRTDNRAGVRCLRPSRVERAIARLAFRLLTVRGWVVRLNEPEWCSDVYETEDGEKLDRGWQPLHSIRFGHTPVYRGVGEVRWRG
jgi:hypothetical protein